MRGLRALWGLGLLLCAPAVVLAAIGWRSLAREHASKRSEAASEASAVAERTALEQADSLEALRAREEARPYYHYADRYQPADVTVNVAAFVPSPLADGSDDPRLLGWFQWLRLSNGNVAPVETFGPGAEALAGPVTKAYGGTLQSRLREAAGRGSLERARVVDTPLATVAANEEKAQLMEEIEVAQRVGGTSTDRLQNYWLRVQSKDGGVPTIGVQTTPFSYVARYEGVEGPPLVAYRIVWIPGHAAEKSRDAPSDRWLLQGYALDPGRLLPTTWTAATDGVVVCRGDCASRDAPAAESMLARRSIADLLHAEVDPGWRRALFDQPLSPESFVVDSSQTAAADSVDEGPSAPPATLVVETDSRSSENEGGRRSPKEATLDGSAAVTTSTVSTSAVDPDASLIVVAAPALAEIEEGFRSARKRFLFLVLGLGVVVAVGLGTLLRSVRREMAVARKKEDFVAAVTHELKTPLAGIRMYADMLQGGMFTDADAAGSYAGRIVDEAKRLDTLVDRVLALAAYDRGVTGFHPVPSDLGAVAREATNAFAGAARESGTALRVEVEEGLPPVDLDPALVAPLVGNLVDNAIKYSARSPRKDVAVRVRRSGPAHVEVEVEDQGAGIPAADRARVFEPFYRAGGEETRSAPGVGLGLALVRRYADAHGAEVSLRSEPGRGTAVAVRFPLARENRLQRPSRPPRRE